MKASPNNEWTINDIDEITNPILTIIEEDGISFVYRDDKHKITIQRQYDEFIKHKKHLKIA